MFTGIIEAVGQIAAVEPGAQDTRLRIAAAGLDVRVGDLGASIAVNGVCLTAVAFTDDGFVADVSAETLRCSTLGEAKPGTPVNLERALTLERQLGGHLVSGHVDAVAKVAARVAEGRSWRFTFRAPQPLTRYIAAKGSIAVDGISLTVNRISGDQFDVNIVPHTLECTTLGGRRPGDTVNLEVDVVARYLERLLPSAGEATAVDADLLRSNGYLRQ